MSHLERPAEPTERRERMRAALEAAFPDARDAETTEIEYVRAPGCVHLMGDHTDNSDNSDGFVLAAAIDLDVWIALRRRRDGLVQLASLQGEGEGKEGKGKEGKQGGFWAGEQGGFWAEEAMPPDPGALAAASTRALAAGGAARSGSWIDYVAGTAWSLREAGLPVHGFDGIVDTTIPLGAGLSSWAAMELASALALLGSAGAAESPAALAAIAQRAERDYVGVDSGIADQFAAADGRAGQAMLLDCRSLESRHVALPAGLRVVVCDTGSPPEPRASTFTERRAECGRAVALLAEQVPSVSSLRDVDPALLRRHRHVLPETVARRAEHVVTENVRAVAAADALEAADLERLGALFAASHESLRSRYEVSCHALDEMVAVATSVPGVVGARMTGAGFGGCTVNLVREEAAEALATVVADEYPRRTGLSPRVYSVAISDGAGNV